VKPIEARIQEPAQMRVGAAGWMLHVHESVPSTNDLARTLPSWSAVVAASQHAGRGRLGRSFVSDEGGLWLSAVVPAQPPASRWLGFSLAVGWHVRQLLRSLGITGARLRWPNDLMVGGGKVAGLLIEQAAPGTLCVGIGLNLTNEPWRHDPALEGHATRLADWMSAPAPSALEMAPRVLDAIAHAHEDFLRRGMAAIIADLNGQWQRITVALELHEGPEVQGCFEGLDADGNLLLSAGGISRMIPHPSVRKLVEIHPSQQTP
jgi:BirA family biotin operon repressor/biotin-[acetyl-CoA-carboxylase] ligase